MFRIRKFELKHYCDSSSWKNFADMFNYILEKKNEIEKTFSIAAFDLNFQEPMNIISIECDFRSPEAHMIVEYAKKINNLFKDNSDKIVIDFKVKDIPASLRNNIFFTHEWAIKENI